MSTRSSGHTDSLWMRTAPSHLPRPLTEDLRADVCVIGAGIAGITSAYMLARAGKQVVVLEDGEVGGGDTGRTEGARLAAESHTVAIDIIEATVQDERIDCRSDRDGGYRRLRDQCADRRLAGDRPSPDGVSDIRDRSARAVRYGTARVVLGYGRPVSLRTTSG